MEKALSLTQPYATLIALGYKLNETRPKRTSHRGPLLIHASATRAPWARQVCEENPIIRAILEKHGLTYGTLPRGVLLCRVQLLDVATIVSPASTLPLQAGELNPATLSETEFACGDYTPGRFAWQLADIEVLPEPVRAKGSLILWDATAALQAHAIEQATVQGLAAERARYRYLPADELMAAAGYEHTHLGRYEHRTADVHAPRYSLSFFSESGEAVLQRLDFGAGNWRPVASEPGIRSDEQLQYYLQRHQFPAINPNSVGV